jgi:hypothetical protein
MKHTGPGILSMVCGYRLFLCVVDTLVGGGYVHNVTKDGHLLGCPLWIVGEFWKGYERVPGQ